jgi:hypothetical protein
MRGRCYKRKILPFSVFAHRVLERWGAVDFFHDLAIVAIAFPAFRNRA